VLVVNDIGALLRTLELGGEYEPGREMLDHLASGGPARGITLLMSSTGEHGAPARLLGQFQQRIVLHLDDRVSYRALDVVSARIPMQTPGRAITVPDLVEIQIATIADLEAAVNARSKRPSGSRRSVAIARTPDEVYLDEISKSTEFQHDTWRLPVGLDTRTLEPGVLHLQAPAGALILGDAGAGKSTVLTNLARCAINIGAEVDIHAIASTWSPLLLLPRLTSATTLAGLDKWAAEFFDRADRARLVLIDDPDPITIRVVCEADISLRVQHLHHLATAIRLAARRSHFCESDRDI
jgi:hypothetical protein